MGLQFPRRRAPLGAVWARLHAQCKFPRHPRGENPPAASDPTKTADLGRFGAIWGHQGPPNVKPARLIPPRGAPRHRGGTRRPCCYAAAARRRVGAIQWSKMAIRGHFRPFLALAGYESPSYRQPRTWQTCRVAQVCLWRAPLHAVLRCRACNARKGWLHRDSPPSAACQIHHTSPT